MASMAWYLFLLLTILVLLVVCDELILSGRATLGVALGLTIVISSVKSVLYRA
jgi:hypothetical protein